MRVIVVTGRGSPPTPQSSNTMPPPASPKNPFLYMYAVCFSYICCVCCVCVCLCKCTCCVQNVCVCEALAIGAARESTLRGAKLSGPLTTNSYIYFTFLFLFYIYIFSSLLLFFLFFFIFFPGKCPRSRPPTRREALYISSLSCFSFLRTWNVLKEITTRCWIYSIRIL